MANTPCSISLLGVHQIDGVWALVADGLENACRRTGGYRTADHFWRECRAGGAFLVVAARDSAIIAAAVFCFERWTSGKKLRCLCVYGKDMKSWLPQGLELVREMMRAGDAEMFVWGGRKGWERMMKGARFLSATYEVKL